MSAVPLLHDFLLDSAQRLPDKVALVCGGARLTYGELDRRSNALAHALGRRGVQRGDRVLVFSENTAEACVAFWGVLKADAVVSVVHPSTKVDKLAWLLNDCRASALIADGSLAHVFFEAARSSPHLKAVISFGAPGVTDTSGVPGLCAWDDALREAPADAPPQRRGIDVDLAAIIYTSGSTGEPKGVMLTHRNMLTAAASITSYLRNQEDDVILLVLPLAFNYGLYQLIMAFKLGARLILERSFTYPARSLRVAVEEGVTGFPGVPTVFALLAELKDPAAFDLGKVRYVTNTAAPLEAKHVAAIRRLFPAASVYSMYGLTECKRCTYLPPEDLDRKPNSVGIAIPNAEVWIVDEQGQRLGPDEVGELVVRGSNVMRGYWEKPEQTAERLRPGPLPGESVLYTGDLCRMDSEGYVYFVARKDEVIKSRGEKVAPREVERVIVTIEGVREAVVIGVPDELLGQAIKAFVVVEAGSALTGTDVVRACQQKLEAFMVPKLVELVTELPRTATGKIKKTDLR
jgi:amino acid adenylation domain-containing protein